MTQESNVPKLVIKRVIPAKREEVFEAWTKPEIMQKWFFPGTWSAKSSNDLRVGGCYSHNMISDGSNSGCDHGDSAEDNIHAGEYLEIVPPERLVFTWNSDIVKNSRVTVVLRDLGDSTELTLTHELLETEHLRSLHNGGWDACLENLLKYFS